MRTLYLALALALSLAVAACGDNLPRATITADATWADALADYVSLTGEGLRFEQVAAVSPPTADADAPSYQIAIVDDAAIPLEGYRVDPVAGLHRSYVVHAHDVLGAQYGLSDALEQLGFRFRHPLDIYAPPALEPPPAGAFGVAHQPQVRVRGLQLHTLHPIEPYFALWDPTADPSDYHHIIDWVVKNRGNFIQWAPLNNIYDANQRAAWQTYTAQIIAYAHMRGIRVGVNIELFSLSNLQEAFNLIDNDMLPIPPQIAAREPLIVDGLPFDVYDISFGEFSDADPQTFIDAVNEATAEFHQLAPSAEVHGVIHVGGNLLVTYMGQTMIYYFLLQYADPSIVADVHTVMYFDLFESADGAYQMTDFSPHRQFLIDHMCAGERASYFPEDAYWVTFDDSVPMFLPLYVRSRWYDLQQLAAAAPPPCVPLDEHLMFSSGWEWGYWLNDTTSLRSAYELPASSYDAIAEQLAPDAGSDLAQIISDVADAQHDALIGQSLAGYLAGRDAVEDGGAAGDDISQPTRTSFADLAAAGSDAVAEFVQTVQAPLAAHAAAMDQLVARLEAVAIPDSRWGRELRDGVLVDRDRAKFVAATYQAALDHLAGDAAAATADVAAANAALADGQAVVHARDADLHDTAAHGNRLISRSNNDTIYPYGYLYFADSLCYWNREMDELTAMIGSSTAMVRSCDLE